MNRLKYSRSTASTLACAAASASAAWATPSGVASPLNSARLLSRSASGRAQQQRCDQRVFLCARGIDFVGLARGFAAIEIGPQDGAVDAGDGFDDDHALGRHPRPVRHRRLRDADLARELAHAANGADRLVQARIAHRFFISPYLWADVSGGDAEGSTGMRSEDRQGTGDQQRRKHGEDGDVEVPAFGDQRHGRRERQIARIR